MTPSSSSSSPASARAMAALSPTPAGSAAACGDPPARVWQARRMRACLLIAAVAGMLAAGCGSDAGQIGRGDAAVLDAASVDAPPPPPPPSEPGRHTIEIIETRRVVPSPGLPGDLAATGANNNLDVVRHADGRVYLAWRNAPDHFASTSVVINVVSSTDETSWQREASYTQGTDLREPRFLS